MSYFDDASLVMIPSGYKDQKVYSVKPIDGSGDLTFSRASNATRVNSSGLVEKVRTNTALYSDDFNNGWYTKGNTIVSSNAIANPLDGAITADGIIANTVNSYHTVTATSPISGSTTFSLYVKAAGKSNFEIETTSGQVSFNLSSGVINYATGGTGVMTSVGSGWYRCSASFPSLVGGSYVALLLMPSTGTYEGFAGDGTTIQLYYYGAQFETGDIATDYIATTTTAVSVGPVSGLPRLDYSGGASCPSLLLEGQRTNLAYFSEQMTLWANGVASVTANATTSPDGYQNADSINNIADVSTFVTATNGVYTWSLFVKQGTSASASIDMSDGATGDVITTFTFATKTFSGTNAGGSWTSPSTAYQDYGNGWYRISLTATKGAGSSIGYKIVASGTGTTFVWGAQLEAGAYATSYIGPTYSSAVTRVADSASKTGIASLIGQSEGAFYCEVDMRNLDKAPQQLLELHQDANNRFGIAAFWDSFSSINRMQLYQFFGGGLEVNIQETITSGVLKVAAAYKANDYVLYINGVQVGTDTSASVPTASILYLGSTGSNFFVGNGVKQVLLFKTRLSNADLATLTA